MSQVLSAADQPVTDQVSAKKDSGFRPDIQGLRALAVTMVVIYHLYPSLVPGGFAGVDVFFVISGYLITGHLWRGYQRDGKVSLLDFWGRRARRLVPAAALVLAVTWVAARFVLTATRLSDTAEQVRASALYFQNWELAHEAVNYLTADDAATPVQHFWSLSVEEQFYLIWPLLFVVAALLTRRYRWVVLTGFVVTLVAASLAYSVYYTRVNPVAAYFVTTTRIWELGAGGLLALLPRPTSPDRPPGLPRPTSPDRPPGLPRPTSPDRPPGLPDRVGSVLRRQGWLGWVGLVMVIASAFVLRGTYAFPGYLALLPVAGAVLLIAGGTGPARLTSARPMVFLGGISYSLYLWHWPVIDLWNAYTGKSPGVLSGLVMIAVSVVLAWLTRVFVEDRVRLSPKLTGHGWRSLSMALAAVVPVILVSVYIAAIPGQWDGKLGPGYPGAIALADKTTSVTTKPVLPPPDDAREALPEYWQQGCLDGAYAVTPKVCVYGDTTKPTLTVALVGDSVAGNWFPDLEKLAVKYHWKLITDVHATCTWTATMTLDPNNNVDPYTSCHEWGVTVLHDLVTSIRPDVVITSDLALMGTAAHPKASTAYAQIGAGMASYWTQLENHGISVVPIQETPTMGFNPPDCVAKHGASSAICDRPSSEAIPQDPPTVQAAKLMAGKVKVIDMNQFICDKTVCPSVVGNVLVYFDAHHLTSSYAKTMTRYLAPRLFSTSAVLASHR